MHSEYLTIQIVITILVLQIMTMCDAATTALTELKVEHKEDLVVPFRIPWFSLN